MYKPVFYVSVNPVYPVLCAGACVFGCLFYRHAKQPKPDHPFAWPGQTRSGPEQLQLNSYGS